MQTNRKCVKNHILKKKCFTCFSEQTVVTAISQQSVTSDYD